jgi:hypothetical protein
MRRLRLLLPCPVPSAVKGEHCDVCNTRVHDLTKSPDPAADVARLSTGARICARVLVTAIALEGCSGAMDPFNGPTSTTPVVKAAEADSGIDWSDGLLGQIDIANDGGR